jgi:hypothetical protein
MKSSSVICKLLKLSEEIMLAPGFGINPIKLVRFSKVCKCFVAIFSIVLFKIQSKHFYIAVSQNTIILKIPILEKALKKTKKKLHQNKFTNHKSDEEILKRELRKLRSTFLYY